MTMLRWPCWWWAWLGLCWALVAAERPTPQPDPILESDQPDAPKQALKLPVLADGPGKGFHLFYEGKTYDGAMSELGDVRIRLKDNAGKPIGDWWVISPGIRTSWQKLIGYNSREKPIYKGFVRYMKEIREQADATDKPRGKLTYKALLMDDVEFTRSVEFERDTVKVWSGFKCGNKGYGSEFRGAVEFAPCMKFKPDVELVDRQKALEGYTVRMDAVDAKGKKVKMEVPYSESTRFPGRVWRITAVGPWQNREVEVWADRPFLEPHMYTGNCPHQGFSVRFGVGNNSLGLKDQLEYRLTIR